MAHLNRETARVVDIPVLMDPTDEQLKTVLTGGSCPLPVFQLRFYFVKPGQYLSSAAAHPSLIVHVEQMTEALHL